MNPSALITPFTQLICPLDGTPLLHDKSGWRCANGHCFDIASQGYTNLLPVQHKRSLDPGDSKEMVAARRRFLNAGHYQPIADALIPLSLHTTDGQQALSCLDAGCGEGYYLRRLAAGAEKLGVRLAVLGLDISKWAVLAAAKQEKRMGWVVGSNANLPVPANSIDRLLCLFGFPVYGEFARVLKIGGQLVQVDAGPDHLRELREIIYPSLKAERKNDNPPPTGFRLEAEQQLNYGITVNSAESIADLLTMTPHLYRASPQGRAKAAALTTLSLTVDVKFKVLRRVAA